MKEEKRKAKNKAKNKPKIKLKGALKAYMQWPVWLALLLLCMVLSIYVVDKEAAGVMMIYTAVYLFIALILFVFKRPYIIGELVRFAADHGQVQHSFVKELDIPYGIIDIDGRLVWANNELKDIVKYEKIARTSIREIFEDLSLEQLPTVEEDVTLHMVHGGKNYRVLMRLLDMSDYRDDVPWMLEEGDKQNINTLIGMYLYDETENVALKKENFEEKMLVGLLYIDNYEEALRGETDMNRALMSAWVEKSINKYMESIDAVVKRLEKDKFIFVFKQKYLEVMRTNRFSILEDIRNINFCEATITISIGVGVGAPSYRSGYDQAKKAIDKAFDRGGDQAIVMQPDEKFESFGATMEQNRNSARVKARIKAQELKGLITGAEQILIMGHSMGDPDSFGSSIGVYRMAKALGKKAQIVLNVVPATLRPILEMFQNNQKYEEDMFISGAKAQELIDGQTLLVVVDTSQTQHVECTELLELTKNIAVIDHHRQQNKSQIIENMVFSYIETSSSSVCEMLSEMLPYIGENLKLEPVEADAMYAGIMIDTNNFLYKTGVRTMEAAAYLQRNKANVVKLRKMLRTDFAEYQVKAHVISSSEVFMDHYVFATLDSEGLDDPGVLISKAANELLNIDNIDASFVFTELNGGVKISARSIDKPNVEVIMNHEKIKAKGKGGGHMSMAAAFLNDCTIEEAIELVKDVLRDMTEKGEIK